MTVVTEEPTGVAQVLTPSGIEIFYQSGPKRLYRIFSDTDMWQEVPSVSTVLGVLDKPALVWWAMKVGVQGVVSLHNEIHKKGGQILSAIDEGDHDWLVEQLKEHRLTVNHQRDKAADRGTNVHTALESWAETGITPDPRFYPENERGYVQGLVNFINDAQPKVKHSELMVASLDGYAGRFDLVADISGNLVTKTYPKREDIRKELSGTFLLDLKTSKDAYKSYSLQLAAYRSAMEECGYGTVDRAAVVRVTGDGRYEVRRSKSTSSDFRAALTLYHVMQRELFE